ncbi:hypothetical protein [Neisseria meningitidis serogroup B]|uniref:Uncharacterized protein n=1 Tax=Neisseria meningitidis serogroup B TaxID=491 RepID=A0A0H5QFF9_NEIMI|nr:hypothetical protein [Neisseria meningitidis serogroup B]
MKQMPSERVSDGIPMPAYSLLRVCQKYRHTKQGNAKIRYRQTTVA